MTKWFTIKMNKNYKASQDRDYSEEKLLKLIKTQLDTDKDSKNNFI